MATISKSLLKDLPVRLQDSSVKCRVEFLTSIKNELQNGVAAAAENDGQEVDAVPAELAVKFLAKNLPMVLPRFVDNKSRTAALDLLKTCLEKFPETSVKSFSASLHETLAPWANSIFPTVYLAKIAIYGLQWMTLIVLQAAKIG